MQKKLLVLAADILQVPVIKKAKEMGIYVIAADGDPNAVGLKYADNHPHGPEPGCRQKGPGERGVPLRHPH